MIRLRLRELIAEKHFREGKLVTITDIARDAGINRMTVSKIANDPTYNTETGTLNALCRYFGCRIEQLVEYVPDDTTGARAVRGGTKRSKPAKSRR